MVRAEPVACTARKLHGMYYSVVPCRCCRTCAAAGYCGCDRARFAGGGVKLPVSRPGSLSTATPALLDLLLGGNEIPAEAILGLGAEPTLLTTALVVRAKTAAQKLVDEYKLRNWVLTANRSSGVAPTSSLLLHRAQLLFLRNLPILGRVPSDAFRWVRRWKRR